METPPDSPAKHPSGEEETSKPAQSDWLARLRGSPPADFESESESSGEQMEEWLGRLREWDTAEAGPSPDEPSATQPGDADFLRARLMGTIPEAEKDDSQSGTDAGWQPPPTSALQLPSEEKPAAPPPPAAAGDIPDWLQSEQGDEGQPPPPSVPEAPDEPSTPSDEPTQELPDWLVGEEPAAPPPAPQAEPTAAPSTPPSGAGPELPDWLQSDVPAAEPSDFAAPPPGRVTTGELPDWLVGEETTAPAPEPQAEPTEAPSTLPFDRLRAGSSGAGPELPDWLQSEAPAAEPFDFTAPPPGRVTTGELPDWLVGEEPAAPPPAPQAEPAAELPDWLQSEQATAADTAEPELPSPPTKLVATGELPDWLVGDETAAPEPTAPAHDTIDFLPPESDALPDWLETASKERSESAPLQSIEQPLPDWLAGDQPETPTAADTAPSTLSAVTGQDLPDWLKATESRTAARPPAEPPAIAPGPGDESLDLLADADSEIPDWLAGAGAADEPPAGTIPAIVPGPDDDSLDFLADAGDDLPDWLQAVRPQDTAAPETAPAGAPTGDMPDWLAAMRPEGIDLTPPTAEPEAELPQVPSEPSGLAQAKLPEWMGGLRPLEEIAGAEAVPTAETDDYEETAGPLAGMVGVLRAEPVVSLPGKPGASVSRFMVSDWQREQADIFRKLMKEEIEDLPAAPRRRLKLPFAIDHVIVFVLIALAVLAPFLLQQSFFDVPKEELYPENRALLEAIASLADNSLVLVAFEYNPGSGGELGDAMEGLLQQIATRGHRLALVSSKPVGPGVAQTIAERALAQAEQDPAQTYGSRYINLGYIPGGAIGLQAFVNQPTTSIQVDFVLGESPWEMEVLAGVSTLEQFALVIVAADSPTFSRAWLEQVQPHGVPMAAVVSAAAQPLVLPYAQGDTPQLVGMVSGLPGAFVNDIIAPRGVSPVSRRWDSFSAGILAAGLILLGGNMLWGAIGLARPPAAAKAGDKPPAPRKRSGRSRKGKSSQ